MSLGIVDSVLTDLWFYLVKSVLRGFTDAVVVKVASNPIIHTASLGADQYVWQFGKAYYNHP